MVALIQVVEVEHQDRHLVLVALAVA
jgi:hypothetical protein